MDKPVTIQDHFEALGAPEHVGHAFLIAEEVMQERFGGDAAKLPSMPYDYKVYQDDWSGNFMILRPEADGAYKQLEGMTELPRAPEGVDRVVCQV
jgi:hypothetical protein